jgi:hypothetical protein
MWEPLQRYSALSREARKLFRRAALLGPLIGVSLRVRGYGKTREWMQKRLDRQAIQYLETPEISAHLEMTCRMVRAAEHYSLVRITCLEGSLVLWYLLQSQGIPATLRIGVRKPAGKFEAHAWVEWGGTALNQTGEQHLHYRAFDMNGPVPPTEQP